jgi:anthranilate phosphoribosyltransferase
MTPQDALARLIEHREIFHDEMLSLMRQIMGGEMPPALIAAIITGLRVKKETIGEITAAAQVMREFSTKVEIADRAHLLDTCGTGGDSANTYNISTATVFVAAAAGAKVAKHGGRSVSSKSGSADILEALGVNLNLTPEQVAQCIDRTGVGFMFAPNHHSAMKHAAPIRRELGVRTLFNILGPLTNPAGAGNQLIGVFHPDLVGILARVLQRLGGRHAMVVHGMEGLDEISISGQTLIGELRDGEVREYAVDPDQFGLSASSLSTIQVRDGAASKEMMLAALSDQPGAPRDILALNAGAAIYLSGRADTHEVGVRKALEVLASGAAKSKLDQFIAFTQKLKPA